ncbi:MAG: TIGR04255 family protein [Deltaproteobacteria bacterium]|nr:TIGR04255 family protein [Deltaproteobacteria bacterium]MBW2086136.1 TIGR04255 family protein [Deltaproteobacteria bacterium]
MIEPRHLTNAPIKEALIDIWYSLDPGYISRLESIHDKIKGDYPHKQIRKQWEGTFQVGSKTFTQSTKDHGIQGYWYLSEDEKQIIQARLNGFTFNKIEPYETWEQMRDEARKLWKIFKEIAPPEVVTGLGLRYVNRIEIPEPTIELSDYLTAPPEIPENLPQRLDSFLTRIQFFDSSIKARGIITQMSEPPDSPGTVPLLLDIEVTQDNNFNINDDEIWAVLEDLRAFKNKIFFSSITERVAELCQ